MDTRHGRHMLFPSHQDGRLAACVVPASVGGVKNGPGAESPSQRRGDSCAGREGGGVATQMNAGAALPGRDPHLADSNTATGGADGGTCSAPVPRAVVAPSRPSGPVAVVSLDSPVPLVVPSIEAAAAE